MTCPLLFSYALCSLVPCRTWQACDQPSKAASILVYIGIISMPRDTSLCSCLLKRVATLLPAKQTKLMLPLLYNQTDTTTVLQTDMAMHKPHTPLWRE